MCVVRAGAREAGLGEASSMATVGHRVLRFPPAVPTCSRCTFFAQAKCTVRVTTLSAWRQGLRTAAAPKYSPLRFGTRSATPERSTGHFSIRLDFQPADDVDHALRPARRYSAPSSPGWNRPTLPATAFNFLIAGIAPTPCGHARSLWRPPGSSRPMACRFRGLTVAGPVVPTSGALHVRIGQRVGADDEVLVGCRSPCPAR